jgi:predicted RNase H-like nuclease (RuvC/YqgF family)
MREYAVNEARGRVGRVLGVLKEGRIMLMANRILSSSLLAGCALILLAARGGAEQPGASTQPATRPADLEPRTSESAREHLERAAENLRVINRVRDLERTVSELARHLGGPTRNLTLRPSADLNSILDQIDREQRDLENEISRLRREVNDLRRRMDRLERRRR